MTDEIERDRRVAAAVACPYCGAARGVPCALDGGRARTMPHAERLAAWRAQQALPSTARPLDARDLKVVATVGCPFCEARKGDRCVRHPGSTIVVGACHPERREVWQAARGPAPGQNAPRLCTCGHGAGQHSSVGCRKCACPRNRHEI